jgi:hypothetical protein
MLRQNYSGALEGVCAAAATPSYSSRDYGELFDGLESFFIKNSGFVVVYNKDTTAGEYHQKWIQIVGIGTLRLISMSLCGWQIERNYLKEIEENGCGSTRGRRECFKSRYGDSIASTFSAND